MSEKKRTRPDDIPALFIDNTYGSTHALHICFMLHIVNSMSLKTGDIYEQWKIACAVVPIFKAGEKDVTSNYRLISVYCRIGFVFNSLSTILTIFMDLQYMQVI